MPMERGLSFAVNVTVFTEVLYQGRGSGVKAGRDGMLNSVKNKTLLVGNLRQFPSLNSTLRFIFSCDRGHPEGDHPTVIEGFKLKEGE